MRVSDWIVVAMLSVGSQTAGASEKYPEGPTMAGDAPPAVELSAAERRILAEGDILIRDLSLADDQRRLAVVRVTASADTVWTVLQDFDRYPEWVDGLESTRIYRRDDAGVFVAFDYRHWLAGNVRYHARHTYPGTQAGWGTWALDRDRPSDLLDTAGFWRVMPVKGEAGRSDVVYSTRIVPADWLARVLGDWFIDDTLRTVVANLRSRVETPATDYLK